MCACRDYTRVYDITLAGDGHEGRGGREGRNTCMATQQFRVKCYVSESVMPMWAEANLWSPVSAHTCSTFVCVRVNETPYNVCRYVLMASLCSRSLSFSLSLSLSLFISLFLLPSNNRDWIGIGTRAGSLAFKEIPRLFELCECRWYYGAPRARFIGLE